MIGRTVAVAVLLVALVVPYAAAEASLGVNTRALWVGSWTWERLDYSPSAGGKRSAGNQRFTTAPPAFTNGTLGMIDDEARELSVTMVSKRAPLPHSVEPFDGDDEPSVLEFTLRFDDKTNTSFSLGKGFPLSVYLGATTGDVSFSSDAAVVPYVPDHPAGALPVEEEVINDALTLRPGLLKTGAFVGSFEAPVQGSDAKQTVTLHVFPAMPQVVINVYTSSSGSPTTLASRYVMMKKSGVGSVEDTDEAAEQAKYFFQRRTFLPYAAMIGLVVFRVVNAYKREKTKLVGRQHAAATKKTQ